MLKLFVLSLLPAFALAQTPGAAAWGGGAGLGNGAGIYVGRLQGHLLVLGRVRYKAWRPASGPGSDGWFSHLDTRSQQWEEAVLAGYAQPVGRGLLYAAGGLGYVQGRKLGEYRFTTRTSGLLGDYTHYYSYRSYQALGLPLEIGLLHPIGAGNIAVSLSAQANLNPEQSVFCLLFSLCGGRLGTSAKPRP